MPVKKKVQKRKPTPIPPVFKLFLFLVLAGVSIKIMIPMLVHSTDVLGISTFLARGGDGGGDRGEGHGQNAEVHGPGNGGDNSPHPINSISAGAGQGEINQPNQAVNVQTESQNQGPHGHFAPGFMKGDDITPSASEQQNEVEGEDVQVATNGGGFDMPGKHLGAISHFPISIDPTTNALIITTPAGTKTVAILPDKAIENILTKGILSRIGGHIASGSAEEGGGSSSGSGTLFTDEQASGSGASDNLELTEENGAPVYKVNGSLNKKLFGLISVSVNKTVTLSAETGHIVSTNEGIFSRILDTLSL